VGKQTLNHANRTFEAICVCEGGGAPWEVMRGNRMPGSQWENLSSLTKRAHRMATARGLLNVITCSDSLDNASQLNPVTLLPWICQGCCTKQEL